MPNEEIGTRFTYRQRNNCRHMWYATQTSLVSVFCWLCKKMWQVAFGKQQDEIAALTRAQEKAEARVSSIHHQLTASESELSVLEGEMAEV